MTSISRAVLLLLAVLIASTSAEDKKADDFERPFQVLAGLIVDKNFFLLRELTDREKASGKVNLQDPFGEKEGTTSTSSRATTLAPPKPSLDLGIASLLPPPRSVFNNGQNLSLSKRKPSATSSGRRSSDTATTRFTSAPTSTPVNGGRRRFQSRTTPKPVIKANTGRRNSATSTLTKDKAGEVSPPQTNKIRAVSKNPGSRVVRKRVRTRTRKVQRVPSTTTTPKPTAFTVQQNQRSSSFSRATIPSSTPPSTLLPASRFPPRRQTASPSVFRVTSSLGTSSFPSTPAPQVLTSSATQRTPKRPVQRRLVISGRSPQAAASQSIDRATIADPVQDNRIRLPVQQGLRGGRNLDVSQNRVPTSRTENLLESNGDQEREIKVLSKSDLISRLPGGSQTVVKDMTKSVFSCVGRPYGYYADMGAHCQVFHICTPITQPDGYQENLRYSFFCNNGTVFDQSTLGCQDEVMAMPCERSEEFYASVKYFEKFDIFDRLREEHEQKRQRISRLDTLEDVDKLEASLNS